MALSIVQSTSGAASYSNALATTAFGSSIAAGNAIVVGIVCPLNTGSDITSVTDTQGNTYTKIGEVLLAADYILIEVWATYSAAGGASNVVTAHDSGWNIVGVYAYEVAAGAGKTIELDNYGTGTSDYAGTSVSTSVTTTVANGLLLGFASKDVATGTWTNTSGWANFLSLGTVERSMAQTKAAATATTYNQTFVSSNNKGLVAIVVALKEVSSANAAPTIVLNTADAMSTGDTTPTLEFTGSDADGDDLRYNIQITKELASYDVSNRSSGTGMDSLDWWGMNFPADGGKIGSVTFSLDKVGLPTGTMQVHIFANTGVYGSTSTPTGSILASSNTISVNDLSTSHALFEFIFEGAEQITLTDGVIYWAVVEWSGTGDASNRPGVSVDTTSPSYAGNSAYSSNGSSWTAYSSWDLPFIVETILDKTSGTDSGFLNTVNGGDTDPFNAGEKISYTVQGADELDAGTYFWRVRCIDPSGLNTWSSWSAERSFTVSAAVGVTVTPAVETATANEIAPSITTGAKISPTVDASTANEQSPSVGGGSLNIVSTESAIISDIIPTITTGAKVTPATEAVIVSEVAPTIKTGAIITTAVDSLTANELAPTVVLAVVATPATETVVLTDISPTVKTGAVVAVTEEAVTVTSVVPTATTSIVIAAELSELVISTVAPTVRLGTVAVMSEEILTISDAAVTVTTGAVVSPVVEVLTISEEAAVAATSIAVAAAGDAASVLPESVTVTTGAKVSFAAEAIHVNEIAPSARGGAIVALVNEALTIDAALPTVSTSIMISATTGELTVSELVVSIITGAVVMMGVESLVGESLTPTVFVVVSAMIMAGGDVVIVNEGGVVVAIFSLTNHSFDSDNQAHTFGSQTNIRTLRSVPETSLPTRQGDFVSRSAQQTFATEKQNTSFSA